MAYTELKEIAEKRFVLFFIFYLELSCLITPALLHKVLT